MRCMGFYMWEMIGLIGMLGIEASYVPQIIRLFQTKKAGDVSPFFPGMNLMGRIMAFAYSMHLGQSILGLGFFIGMTLRAVFLVQVLHYQNRERGSQNTDQHRQGHLFKTAHVWFHKRSQRRAS